MVFIRMIKSMTLKTELQNGVQNDYLRMIFKEQHQIFHMISHIQRAHEKVEVGKNFNVWRHFNMLSALVNARLKKERFVHKKHQNRRLEIWHSLTLDITLIDQQLNFHLMFIKQSSSECLELWRSINFDEVVLLQNGISDWTSSTKFIKYEFFLNKHHNRYYDDTSECS